MGQDVLTRSHYTLDVSNTMRLFSRLFDPKGTITTYGPMVGKHEGILSLVFFPQDHTQDHPDSQFEQLRPYHDSSKSSAIVLVPQKIPRKHGYVYLSGDVLISRSVLHSRNDFTEIRLQCKGALL